VCLRAERHGCSCRRGAQLALTEDGEVAAWGTIPQGKPMFQQLYPMWWQLQQATISAWPSRQMAP
jgi:hypothetical protein